MSILEFLDPYILQLPSHEFIEYLMIVVECRDWILHIQCLEADVVYCQCWPHSKVLTTIHPSVTNDGLAKSMKINITYNDLTMWDVIKPSHCINYQTLSCCNFPQVAILNWIYIYNGFGSNAYCSDMKTKTCRIMFLEQQMKMPQSHI